MLVKLGLHIREKQVQRIWYLGDTEDMLALLIGSNRNMEKNLNNDDLHDLLSVPYQM